MPEKEKYHMPIKLRGIVFDFDGTLVQSNINFPSMRQKIIDHLKRWNVWEESFEKEQYVLEIVSRGCKSFNGQPKSARTFREEAFRIIEDIERKTCLRASPFPGVCKTMKILWERGHSIGIITRNGKVGVECIMSRYCLPHDVLLTRNDVNKVKPHPEHLLKAIEILDLSPSQIMMVGDHPTDMQCGKEAGVFTVGVLSSISSRTDLLRAGADYVLPGVTSILDFLSLDT